MGSRRLADWYRACWLGLVGLIIPSVMGVGIQGLESAEPLYTHRRGYKHGDDCLGDG
jgi:hypothetical protein